MLTDEEDLAMALEMPAREVIYPLEPYPQILEFATMLDRLEPAGHWKGREFFGYTDAVVPERVTRFFFRHRSNGIALGFSSQDWKSLKGMFQKAIALPELAPTLTELSLQYGEVRAEIRGAVLRTGCRCDSLDRGNGPKDADVWKLAVLLGVIQTVADHKEVRNLEADVVRAHGDNAARDFIEQGNQFHAFGIVGAKHAFQEMESAARVENIFDHQDFSPFDGRVQMFGDLHFARRTRIRAVALDGDKIDSNG
jgi:hypothetical protein